MVNQRRDRKDHQNAEQYAVVYGHQDEQHRKKEGLEHGFKGMEAKGSEDSRMRTFMMCSVDHFEDSRNVHDTMQPVVISFIQKDYDHRTCKKIPNGIGMYVFIDPGPSLLPTEKTKDTENSEDYGR